MELRIKLFGSRISVRWNDRKGDFSRSKAVFLGLTIKEYCDAPCFDEWNWVADDLTNFYVTSKNPQAYIRQLRKETAETLCALMQCPYLPLEKLFTSEELELRTDVSEFFDGVQSDDAAEIAHALMLYEDTLLEECREQDAGNVPVPYILRRIDALRDDYARLFAEGIKELWKLAPDLALEVGKAKRQILQNSVALSAQDKDDLIDKSEAREAFQRTRDRMLQVLKLQSVASPARQDAKPEQIFGRADILNVVGAALTDERLVTLHGTGGVGKTTVMMEAARRARNRYPGGVWLLDISLLSQFAFATEENAECLLAWLHSQEPLQGSSPLLLLLDNCEQEIEATFFLVDALWNDAPHVHFLAATRLVQAHDEWGQMIEIAPFSPPDLQAAPTALMRTDALQLFFHHRKRMGYATEPQEPDIRIAAQICIQAAGIPLAMRLLARTPGQNHLPALLEYIRDIWRQQTADSDAHQNRQKTMHNCVLCSYTRLTEAEQLLFRRLSVFVGGFTKEAMQAVCLDAEGKDTYSLLSELIGSGLVQDKEKDRPYFLLEPIRTVAEELLRESGEQEQFLLRYEQWLDSEAAWVESQEWDITLFGSDETRNEGWKVYWKEKSKIEHVIHSLRIKEDFRAVPLELRYIGLIWLEGRIHAGLNLLQFVDRFVKNLARDKDKMAYFLAKAVLTFAQSEDDYTQTITYAEYALEAARKAHDLKFTAFAMCGLGLAQAFERMPEAEANIRNGFRLAEESQDEWAIALAHMNLGAWHWHTGESEEAIVHYQNSLERFRQQNHRIMTILVSNSLAHLICRRRTPSDVREAAAMYLESMKLASERRHLPNTRGLAGCILGASGVASLCGDYKAALRFYAAGRKAYQAVGAGILPPIKRDYLAEMEIVARRVSDADYRFLYAEGEKRKPGEAIKEAWEYFETVTANPVPPLL